jgi:gas vesicle protein
MANTVSVDQLANVIMQGLTEYADAQSDMVKQSVKDVSKEVKKEISAKAEDSLIFPPLESSRISTEALRLYTLEEDFK